MRVSTARKRSACFLRWAVSAVKLAQIPLDRCVYFAELAAQLVPREGLRLGIQCIEPAAVYGDDLAVERMEAAAERHEGPADLADRGAVVLPEVGDRLEVLREPAGQPDQLEIAPTLTLQSPRRLDLVQIAVETDPQHEPRMIDGVAGRLWLGRQAERDEIKHV